MSYLSEFGAEFDVRFTARQRRWLLLPLLLAFPLAVLLGQWVGSLTASNVPPVAFPTPAVGGRPLPFRGAVSLLAVKPAARRSTEVRCFQQLSTRSP